jgi:hypothetical protein
VAAARLVTATGTGLGAFEGESVPHALRTVAITRRYTIPIERVMAGFT